MRTHRALLAYRIAILMIYLIHEDWGRSGWSMPERGAVREIGRLNDARTVLFDCPSHQVHMRLIQHAQDIEGAWRGGREAGEALTRARTKIPESLPAGSGAKPMFAIT